MKKDSKKQTKKEERPLCRVSEETIKRLKEEGKSGKGKRKSKNNNK